MYITRFDTTWCADDETFERIAWWLRLLTELKFSGYQLPDTVPLETAVNTVKRLTHQELSELACVILVTQYRATKTNGEIYSSATSNPNVNTDCS